MRFSKHRTQMTVCILLIIVLLASTLNALQTEAGPGTEPLTFDYSAEDGYQGDYIVVLNSNYPMGRRLSTGFLNKLIETDIPVLDVGDNRVPDPNIYRSKAYQMDDPYTSKVADGQMLERNSWDVGSQRNFIVERTSTSPGGKSIAFQVLAVGKFCRIWTPLNPDYYPLDEIDLTYAQKAANEFDAQFPHTTRVFGDFLDLCEDGLVNLLFYNIDSPLISGITYPQDLYDQVTVRGQLADSNAAPMIHIDTLGIAGIVRIDARMEESHDITRCFPVMTHEFQHLIYESKRYRDPDYRAYWEAQEKQSIYLSNLENETWMTEHLSAAAAILRYPRIFRDDYVPYWYDRNANYEDVCHHFSRHAEVAANKNYMIQRGRTIYQWKGDKDDYSLVAFLAQFAYTRGGEEVFQKAWEIWDGLRDKSGKPKPVQAVAEALGYMDFASFHQDFVLSFLFNDAASEGGRYRLFFDQGDGDPGQMQEALSLLKPPIITGNEAKIEVGGYVVFKPIGGVYVPPITAMEGLQYVGITVNELD
ncbi:MAG: hypothetical protein GXZ04_06795 [Clostridiales bacterium]|nr:hypothetical protein [Clostridiales bacterium]